MLVGSSLLSPGRLVLVKNAHLCARRSSSMAVILGPREIFDSAHRDDRVLSIPYESILTLRPENLSEQKALDLLIISKILRRAPRLTDLALQAERLSLARKLAFESALLGETTAMLFWAEEALRTKDTPAHDRELALNMLHKLAKQNNGKANYLIANELYSLGKTKQALKAYRIAGEQGISQAYTKIGRVLRYKGYHENSIAAFNLGASGGEPNSQFMLGVLSHDPEERLHFLLQAACGGSVEASHNLGEHYRSSGQKTLALEYFRVAATKGFQPSQMNLAILLQEKGLFDESRMWYHQAIKSGGTIAVQAQTAVDAMADRSSTTTTEQHSNCMIL